MIYDLGKISILVPTRKRPKNVRRIVSSILNNAHEPNQTEILFYIDEDDDTFPDDILQHNIRKIVGPRLWLSIMQNILYFNCRGEIIMYAGDDVVFSTPNWDQIVRSEFNKFEDKLILLYGDDRAWYGDKIAIHGFLHRNWINLLGYFVTPLRNSAYDMWHTENARKLGRLVYVPSLVFEHIHYRQGDGKAEFDSTYKAVYISNGGWKPLVTYKKISRERRADRLILRSKITEKTPAESKYLLGEWISKHKRILKLNSISNNRINSLNNYEIIPIMFTNILRSIFRERNFNRKISYTIKLIV